MILFHGSDTPNINTLVPQLADHDRPYVYMTTIEVVAAFYLCNAVCRPFYWFPYGFTESGVPIYHELYPNALIEVSEHRSGYIYTANADESQIIPFKNIPCARLGTQPIKVTGFMEIPNAYAYFCEREAAGELVVGRYEDKSDSELANWHKMILDYITEKELIKTPDCSYAKFVQSKFPFIWEEYIAKSAQK